MHRTYNTDTAPSSASPSLPFLHTPIQPTPPHHSIADNYPTLSTPKRPCSSTALLRYLGVLSLLVASLLTMSPSSLPPMKPESSKQSNASVGTKEYRETVYHDGQGRFIVNSRYFSEVASWVKATEKAMTESGPHIPRSPRSPDHSEVAPRARATVPVASQTANTTQTAAPLARNRHVTIVKRVAKSRTKIVVERQKPGDALKTPGPSRYHENLQYPLQQDWVEVSTPPPTPSIRRLSTPELSDTEDRPFCDCSTQKHVVRYCSSCRREADT